MRGTGGTMVGLLGRVLPLALGAAVSPTLIAALILTLAGPHRPLARGVALTAGAAIPLLAVLLLLTTLWHPGTGTKTGDRETLSASLDITLGVLLLVLLVLRLLRPRARRGGGGPHTGTGHAPGRRGLPPLIGAALLGLTMMAINASTLVLYLAAIKDIDVSAVALTGRLVAGAELFVITLLPLLVILALYAAAPSRANRLLRPLGAWCQEHENLIAEIIFLIFGIYLLARGLIHLLG